MAIGGACGCGLERREGVAVPVAVVEAGVEEVAIGRECEKQQLAFSREVT